MKVSTQNTPTIAEQLSTSALLSRANNRSMLLKVMSSLRYLLKQGLSIRGHREEDGNLIQLLYLRSTDCPELVTWLNNQQYLSHDIINEIITLIGNGLLRQLLAKILAATWFAVLADETIDMANNEQLSISLRWVNESYTVCEDFIGLGHVPPITSDVLTAAIKDVLIQCCLPLAQCRGQCYDGASNMMGRLRGVATQIQVEHKAAISIHCLAHCLNLCLQDAAKNCHPIRNALDVTLQLAKLIKGSPKRTVIFNQCKEDLSMSGTGLRPLCPTRWTVRTSAIDAVLRN